MMIERIVILLMTVALCVSMAGGGIASTGDIDPADPATWTDSTWVYVGKTGTGSVTIDGGSDVVSFISNVGYESGASGTVTVSGTGSTWSSPSDISIGRYGDGSLDINDGATVSNLGGRIGNYIGSTGSATVSGPGSTWSNAGWLDVGKGGDGTLDITDGGTVITNLTSRIGSESDSTGAATVSGAGSTWSSGYFYVGYSGEGSLNITDGGLVEISKETHVAFKPGSSGTLNFDSGRLVTAGLCSATSNLIGTGTIDTNGMLTDVDLVFDDAHGLAQTLILNGPGQNITINLDVDGSGPMGAGYVGNGSLHISDGLAVQSTRGVLGEQPGSVGVATVSGSGSAWNISDSLCVGEDGDGALEITNGSAVSSLYGVIALNPGSTGAVTVSGSGTSWTNSGDLCVGFKGDGALSITNGATVSNTDGKIGYHVESTGVATVSGSGSTWANSGNIHVGYKGNCTLNIADGGLVEAAGWTRVAMDDESTSAISFNNGTLTTGELWSPAADLSGTGVINTRGIVSDVDLVFDTAHGLTQILTLNGPGQNITVNLDVDGSGAMGAGYSGAGSIHISDGIVVQSTKGYLGYFSDASGWATVSGAGSTWNNSEELRVGNYGSGVLEITDGGVVSSVSGSISHGSAVTVSGSGSTWANSSGVSLGGDGMMNITDGGVVTCSSGTIGTSQDTTAAITVSGAGSIWSNSGTLRVGSLGNGTLDITNGGSVSSLYAYVASRPGSTGAVTVSGADSTWTVTSNGGISVGQDGDGTLEITSGGIVSSTRGYIGYNSGSTGAVTISGADSTWVVSLYVYAGRSGSGQLDVTDGGSLSSTRGYIGELYGSTGVVTVSGADSTWTNSNDLFVGYKGDGTLNINNGAAVSNISGVIADYSSTPSRSTGSVTVSGAGSTWTNSEELRVGKDGDGELHITNGAAVSNTACYVGDEFDSTGVVEVSGAGSTWTNSGDLYVGYWGDSTLEIADGAAVSNENCLIGYKRFSTSSVSVIGEGSTWTNSSALYVGYEGSGTVEITNGAVVSSVDYAFIATGPDSVSTVTVRGAGSTWTNSGDLYVGNYGDGVLNISDGGLVEVSGSTYLASRTGSTGAIHFDNGTLTTRYLLAGNGNLLGTGTINMNGSSGDVDLVFDTADDLSQTYILDGPGQNITVNMGYDGSGPMGVGQAGAGSMIISNGVSVQSSEGYLGYQSGSVGVATVTGAGSQWNNVHNLYVARHGSGTLEIINGASVGDSIGYIGRESGGAGSVTVSGAGSTWTNSNALNVGDSGSGSLEIVNGGHVDSGTGNIGVSSSSTGTVTVSGPGSVWTNTEDLNVGRSGNGSLEITNGGAVDNVDGYIGRKSFYDSSGDVIGQAVVSGAGSVWTNSGDLYVGYEGAGELDIIDGGAVSNESGFIGYEPDSTGEVTVSGAGSTWSNADLTVGEEGHGVLNIVNGGLVQVSGETRIAREAGSTGSVNFNNGVLTTSCLLGVASGMTGTGTINTKGLITDVDLVFDTPGPTQTVILDDPGQSIILNVDFDGSVNTGAGYVGAGSMHISGGASVESYFGYLGHEAGSTGTATVSGQGAAWNNAHHIYVGYLGSGVLEIADGGTVSNTYGLVGFAHNVSGAVTVRGTGSSWTSSEDLSVGAGASTLDILDGGRVSSKVGYINGSPGVVTVSGPGSAWINSQELNVGDYFGDGELYILNGGVVSDADGVIGNSYYSTGEVTVSGDGSTWTNSGDLIVGSTGDSSLDIADGGSVSNVDGEIGYRGIGRVTVSGAGSTWTNSGDLIVGNLADAVLEITNGAAVRNIHADIGYYSTAVVTVSGSGSTWTNSGTLYVGRKGSGTLDIFSGGSVSNSNGSIGILSPAAGVVRVSGAGSTWTNSGALYVGELGSGTMEISNGASVSDTEGSIARKAGSTGTVTVSGAGSTWTNSSGLYVGGGDAESGGVGQLTVSSGGRVNAGSMLKVWDTGSVSVTGGEIVAGGPATGLAGWLTIGSDAGSELSIVGGSVSNIYGAIGYEAGSTGSATVSGVGSTWTNSGDFYVGHSGSGTVEITDRAVVTNRHGTLGGHSGAFGLMTVKGESSVWANALYAYIGFYGDGVLEIRDRGAVTGVYGLVGHYSGSTGAVTVSGAGSSWSNSTGLRVGRDGDGAVAIANGGTVSNGEGYIGYGVGSTGTVTVNGSGSSWANGADLYVGYFGAGSLHIYGGGLVSVGGQLAIDDNGGGDSFIQMGSGGMLALFGDGDDSLGDFLGLIGGSDAIRCWDDSILGWVDITSASPGVDYTLNYETGGDLVGYTVLTVIPPTPASMGDTNYDYIVDEDDYDNLVAQFGRAPGIESADFNGDARVDLRDFAILRSNFGSGVVVSAPDAEFGATTPEPATLILMAGCLPVLLRRRLRRG